MQRAGQWKNHYVKGKKEVELKESLIPCTHTHFFKFFTLYSKVYKLKEKEKLDKLLCQSKNSWVERILNALHFSTFVTTFSPFLFTTGGHLHPYNNSLVTLSWLLFIHFCAHVFLMFFLYLWHNSVVTHPPLQCHSPFCIFFSNFFICHLFVFVF